MFVKHLLLMSLVLSLHLYASSYNFSEVRYSDALGKSMTLRGVISFGDASLEIFYDESKKKLHYEDEELSIYEDDEELEVDDGEAMKIAQYFEIIILLYSADKEELNEEFKVEKEGSKTILYPKDEMQDYINKIELLHKNDDLKSLKLFLTNDDTIKIDIEDEVH